MPRRNETRLVDALPNVVSGLVDRIASLAGIALAATFLYFIYALFSGVVRSYPELAYAQRLRILHNLQIASIIFMVSAILVLVYVIVHLWEQDDLAAGMAAVGALLYFGTPFGMSQALGPLFFNNAAHTIALALTNVGIVVLAAAVVRGIPVLIQQTSGGLKGYGDESATRREAAKHRTGIVHPLSPCWALPYCKPFFRDNCIRHKERKTCWRKKNGCMCDDNIMMAMLLRGGGTSAASRERAMLDFLPGAGARGTAGKRLKCGNCFIYLEHQRLKHRYTAPLALPALIAVGWLLLPTVERAYVQFGRWATQVVASVALTQVDTRVLMGTFTNPTVKWLMLFCAGVYALTYVQRLLEYVFFKLKL
ncbi:MAG: hypothetical protein HY321_13255 [Armatimonadetes bacterium]|nr:hypothetical protein [Armatimonadota bacterium]